MTKKSILVALALTVLAACGAVVSCEGSGTATSSGSETETGAGGGGEGGSGNAKCASGDFEAQVIAFCKTQNPPSPKPGELGAGCVDDTQCDSDLCLEPFGSSAYCSLACPAGDECPIGYDCSDTGTGLGAACYQGVCIYGGDGATDCTKNLLDELDRACRSSCALQKTKAWLDCLAGAGRLCGNSDADDHCGVERGLLEACCIECDGNDW